MRMRLAAVIAAVSAPVLAEPPPRTGPQATLHNAQHAAPCQCRAMGRMYNMGDQICLDLGEGHRAYSCDMDQNVTSWKKTNRSCPES